MNLIEALKQLPKERIKYDPEFKQVYLILKEAFETGEKSPAQNSHTNTGGVSLND